MCETLLFQRDYYLLVYVRFLTHQNFRSRYNGLLALRCHVIKSSSSVKMISKYQNLVILQNFSYNTLHSENGNYKLKIVKFLKIRSLAYHPTHFSEWFLRKIIIIQSKYQNTGELSISELLHASELKLGQLCTVMWLKSFFYLLKIPQLKF